MENLKDIGKLIIQPALLNPRGIGRIFSLIVFGYFIIAQGIH
jgi:hypothetical protein